MMQYYLKQDAAYPQSAGERVYEEYFLPMFDGIDEVGLLFLPKS